MGTALFVFTEHLLNEIARSRSHIVIDTANIFTQQPHGNELCTYEEEQHSEEGEDSLCRPI